MVKYLNVHDQRLPTIVLNVFEENRPQTVPSETDLNGFRFCRDKRKTYHINTVDEYTNIIMVSFEHRYTMK